MGAALKSHHTPTPQEAPNIQNFNRNAVERRNAAKRKKNGREGESGHERDISTENKNKCAREKGWPSGKRGEYNSSSIAWFVSVFFFVVVVVVFGGKASSIHKFKKASEQNSLKTELSLCCFLGHPPVHAFLECRRISDVVVSRTYWRMLCDEERRCLDLVTTQGQVGRCVMAQ
jgi:hypothetical protein